MCVYFYSFFYNEIMIISIISAPIFTFNQFLLFAWYFAGAFLEVFSILKVLVKNYPKISEKKIKVLTKFNFFFVETPTITNQTTWNFQILCYLWTLDTFRAKFQWAEKRTEHFGLFFCLINIFILFVLSSENLTRTLEYKCIDV